MVQQLNHSFSGAASVATLLTVSDVAGILGLSVKTVNKLVREKKPACVQVTARDRRFTNEQVQGACSQRKSLGLGFHWPKTRTECLLWLGNRTGAL